MPSLGGINLLSRPVRSLAVTRASTARLVATEDAGSLYLRSTRRWTEDGASMIGYETNLLLSKANAYRCDKGH